MTGGKFSYIKDFQNAFHEKLTGEWNLSTVLSFEALLNFAAWYGESIPDINFSSSSFDGFLDLRMIEFSVLFYSCFFESDSI